MGDFNLNLLNYEDHLPTDQFVNTLYSYGFRPLITKPTRINPHTASLIDNILTNSDLDITAGLLYSDISDHYPLFQLTASCFQKSVHIEKTFVNGDINNNSCILSAVILIVLIAMRFIKLIRLTLLTIPFFLSLLLTTIIIFLLLLILLGNRIKINRGSPSL